MISTTGLNHSSILLGNLVVNKHLSSVPIWASSASNSCLQVHLSSPQWLLPLPANVSTDSGRTVIFSNVKAGPEGQGFSSWIYWKCLTLQKVSSNLNSKRTETLFSLPWGTSSIPWAAPRNADSLQKCGPFFSVLCHLKKFL